MKHETLIKLDPRTVRAVKALITQALTQLERAIVEAKTVEHRKRSAANKAAVRLVEQRF